MDIVYRSHSMNQIITSCESAKFLWKKSIIAQQHMKLGPHTAEASWDFTASSIQPALFDNSSLNKVPVARSSLEGSVSEGCRTSVFTQKRMWNVLPCQCDQLSPCRELRQAFRLSSRVSSLQSFSLFPQDQAVILQQWYYLCVFSILSSSKAGWRFLVL